MGGTPAWQRAGAGGLAFTVVLVLALILAGARAHALAPPTPWDGVNPFRCTIQDAGQGSTVPDPGADPYCVRFDKSNQNVTQLGLITFLTQEPARFSAAAPKCFYYQEDHWRGSLIQSDQQTVIYEFYGHYFFNKATGDGGVWVTHFAIAGRTFDPRTLPGFPHQYDAYFGPGTGGFVSHDDASVDPSCAAKAVQSPATIYATPPRCTTGSGRVGFGRLGPVRLGMTERAVRAALGPPQSLARNYLSYCVTGGGSLLVGHKIGTGGPGARTVMVITTSGRFLVRGRHGATVSVGAPRKAVQRAFPRAATKMRVGRAAIVQVGPSTAGALVLGVVGGRVAYLATYSPAVIRSDHRLAVYLRRGL
jgi:hypothetical protein